jgi:hypothetical protein
VHYGETLYGWLYRSKGEVTELVEKEKGKGEEDRTHCWLRPDPGGIFLFLTLFKNYF